MCTAGRALEVVFAKPQTEKKFDVANLPSSPHPNFIPSPGYGTFPVGPYGHLAPGYGATAGFQQVVILLSHDFRDCVTYWLSHFLSVYLLTAYDLWKGTNACGYADGTDGFT